jgi:hypothetical protein
VTVLVDEFQQVCAENVKILLEMARSLDISLVLSHQDISQLKTGDYDITSTVESCTTFKATLEASSLAAMKQMEEYSGENRVPTLSWSQQARASFDENDESNFSPAWAYPRHDSETPLLTVGETLRPRISRNEILAVSAHPLLGFVRSRTDSGLTQHAGQWSVVEFEFPTTREEYDARTKTPWPAEHPSCITLSAGEDEDAPPALRNGPLPVPQPSQAVDAAIAERLRSFLPDRNGHGSAGG